MRRLPLLSTSFGIVLAALAVSSSARATQPLEEFLASAKAKNFELREQRAQVRQSEATTDAAFGRLLPGFTARGVYTRNQFEVVAQFPGAPTKIVIQPENQLDAYLQLDVPLVDVASYYRYRAADAGARASTEQAALVELQAASAIARAYFQFVGASAIGRAAQESVRLAEANAQNVGDRLAAGAATELDRQRALANVERAKQDVADAELLRATSARALETTSGLAPSESETLAEDDLAGEAPLEAWLARAGETPADRAARAAGEAAELGHTAAKAAFVPTLGATALERLTNATGFANRSAIYLLQLSLTWHVDFAMLAQQRAQEAALDVSRVREEKVRRSGADAIFDAYQRVLAATAKCRSSRAQAAAAKRAAELAVDRYGAGASTQLEVTQAQRDAFLAAAARIGADAELALSRTALRLAAGRLSVSQRTP
jgi:outer membrane protein TolC